MSHQKVVIYGVSGSLGTQCLEVVLEFPERFQLVGGSVGSNRVVLNRLRGEFPDASFFLATASDPDSEGLARSREDLLDEDVDIAIFVEGGVECRNALMKAVAMRKKVLLANKELLVGYGEDVVYLAKELQGDLLPLDSELCAVFQALRGEKVRDVRRVVLTASGGALRDRTWDQLSDVTSEEVLRHPTWKMGKKITVDSATLVNKAFEVIEAHYLFGVDYGRIEVRLHQDSLVHAIVEFEDGFSKMVAGLPDMKDCIRYCIGYPERLVSDRSTMKRFDFDCGLDFLVLQSGRYPCFDVVLAIARQRPELLPELVRADEEAVGDFLAGTISYHRILDRLIAVENNAGGTRWLKKNKMEFHFDS